MKINRNNQLFFRRSCKNRKIHILFTGLAVMLLLPAGSVQSQDNTRIQKVRSFFGSEVHSPAKATVYSAILPGWGQAYNRKYWKIPIVYAGIAGAGYFIKTNNDQYVMHKEDYLLLEADPTAQTQSFLTNKQEIRIRINEYRRMRDLSVIGLVAWYGLVLIDANVDGHFFNYDVDEDLSFELKPETFGLEGMSRGVGLSLVLKFGQHGVGK